MATFEARSAAIRTGMAERGIDLLIGVHDGAHFIEKPNPVMVLSGFKSLGPAAVVLTWDGEGALAVVPAWDAARAAERCPRLTITGGDDRPSFRQQVLAQPAIKHQLITGGLHHRRRGVQFIEEDDS